METYTAERRTAVHEAGHAVMAYLVRRPFTVISVLSDDDSYGRVEHAPPGAWFQLDIEATNRVRTRIEHHVMICLAGTETEAQWAARAHGAPTDWEDQLKVGAAHDMMPRWTWPVMPAAAPKRPALISSGSGSEYSTTSVDGTPKVSTQRGGHRVSGAAMPDSGD